MKSLLLSAALVACLAVSAARAEVIEQFQAEDWSGLAYADDDSGAFHNCIVFAGYRNGATLMMIRTVENSWTIAFDHDDWQLTPGHSYQLQYKIDRRRAVQTDADSLNPTQLSIAADDRLIDQIRRGEQLTVTFDGREYAFELSNSGTALQAAQDCVERHRGTVHQAAAPSDSAAPAATPAPVEEPGGNAAQAVATSERAEPETDEPASAAEADNASTLDEQQAIGNWVVTATDDGAGNFANCSAFGVEHGYDNQLILSYTPEGKWEFGLYRADWSLSTDGSYFIWYNVDRSVEEPGVMKRPVDAVEPTRIFFEVNALETLIERAATGRQLNLQLRGPGMEPQDISYSLDRADEALDATRACVAQHIAAGATQTSEATPQADAGQSQPQAADGPSLPPIGEEKVETLEVPGWDGGAYADAAGTFTHCGISAEYQNGSVLAFARTADNSLLLALARSDWTLQPQQWSPIRFSYGKDLPINNEGEAQAVNATILATNMGRDDTFLEQLKQAPTLEVEAEGHSLSFDISDLAPGLEAIDECRQRHLAPAAAVAPSGKAAPGAAAQETAEEEGARYTADLLTRSGYPEHNLLSGDNRPDGFERYDTVWEIGEILGMLTVQAEAEGLTLTQVRNKIISDDAASCEGEFATGTLASQGGSSVHLYSSCKTDQSEFGVFYAIVPRPRGGFYIVMHIGLDDGAAARAISGKVYDAALP